MKIFYVEFQIIYQILVEILLRFFFGDIPSKPELQNNTLSRVFFYIKANWLFKALITGFWVKFGKIKKNILKFDQMALQIIRQFIRIHTKFYVGFINSKNYYLLYFDHVDIVKWCVMSRRRLNQRFCFYIFGQHGRSMKGINVWVYEILNK